MGTKSLLSILPLVGIFIFSFHVPVVTGEVTTTNDKADELVQNGYLFFLDKFIPAPYVVVANGQQVTINGVVVFESHAKSVNEKLVPVEVSDPGPPPAGLSPLADSQEALDYWVGKSVYLNRTNDLETAKRLFVEAVVESKSGVKAWIDTSHPNGVMLQGDTDAEYFPLRNERSFAPDPDPVGSAEKAKKSQARVVRNSLKGGSVVWIVNMEGSLTLIAPNNNEDFLRLMTEDSAPEVKLAKMVALNIVKYYDDQWPRLIRGFKDWTALREYRAKLSKTKQEAEKELENEQAGGVVPAR